MDPNGDELLTAIRNDRKRLVSFGLLVVAPIPVIPDNTKVLEDEVRTHNAEVIKNFCSEHRGYEVRTSRIGGRLSSSETKKYQASGSNLNVTFGSDLDCVSCSLVNAKYLVSGCEASKLLLKKIGKTPKLNPS